MHNQYRKKREFLKNCIFMMCLIFLILSGFKPEHAEAYPTIGTHAPTDTTPDPNADPNTIAFRYINTTTNANNNTNTYTNNYTNTGTNTNTNTYTYPNTNTYTNNYTNAGTNTNTNTYTYTNNNNNNNYTYPNTNTYTNNYTNAGTNAGTNTGTNTNTNTNTQTNTYTNTVNGEVVTSSENKTTRYTVTTMVNGVEQTGTIVDDGIMLKYDDGLGVMSYLIPGDGQMLFLQETPLSQLVVGVPEEPPSFRPLTIKTFDKYFLDYGDVGNDGSLIDPNRQPVIITHGYNGSYDQMLALGAKYDPAKYQVFYVDYGSFRGIDDIAKDLADKVNNNVLQFYSGKAPIIFEQHSMGCAIVYYGLANGLVDMSKIDTALMISIAPLYGSYGKPEYFNFLIGLFHSQAFAQGNTAAFFDALKSQGLPSNVKHIVIATIDDGTNSMGQQLNLGYDGLFTISNINHVEILTDDAVDRITNLYIDFDGTFIRKMGDWNMAYQHGRLTALYYNNFDGPGNGLAVLTDDTGNFTGQFSTYTGSYIEGNANELIIVNGDYSQRTYLSDGSWDEETMFGIQHFNSEGISIGYTITTGVDPMVMTLNDTEQSGTVLYKKASLLSSANQIPVLVAIGNKSVNEGVNLAFTVSATDPDGNTLTYSATGLPTGATFNASTCAFNWTPNYNQSGIYSATFTVTDSGGLSDSKTIAITVNNVNQPPVLAAIGNKSVNALPDLVMTAVRSPTTATRGTSIGIRNTVKNQGTGASARFTVGVYVSKDAVITTADTRVASRTVGSLAAGASSSATLTVAIPATAVTGTYYIGAIADYSNTATESNETNNARAGNTIVVQF